MAGDILDRQGGAAAGITIHLGQDDSCDADAVAELLCASNSILARHGVGYEERLDRLHLSLDLLELNHERIIDMEPAGRIDHEGVEAHLLAMAPSRAAKLEGVVDSNAFKDRQIDRLANNCQLISRGRPVNVDREQ